MDLDHIYKILSDGAISFEELKSVSPSFIMQLPIAVFKRYDVSKGF